MEEIPGPKGWPLIGNLFELQSDDVAIKAFERLADTYGPIFKIVVMGKPSIFIASAALLQEVTNEKNFLKVPPVALDASTGPRGLFVAYSHDPDWGQAHRILMPAFGPLAVQDMFEDMKDIANQLCLKWARAGEESEVLLTEDFTRLTLDTIALCGMNYRFNSFYKEGMHPFVAAMVGVLGYSGKKATRPWFVNKLKSAEEAQFKKDLETMHKIANEIVQHRKNQPVNAPRQNDLLQKMLHEEDPKTGEKMRDELIAENMVGFLIAGHETTSGLLSFFFMNLLQNPETYLRAQKEVDDVIGTGDVEKQHLEQLKYIGAALRETLRLTPTAPLMTKKVHPDRKKDFITVGDSKYYIDPDVPVRCLLGKCMIDPDYFGNDAHIFKPERMSQDNPQYNELLKAWKPFGNGSRSCIGQNLALQEATLIAAMILQNFDMVLKDPNYQLRIQQNLTIKPADLFVKVRLRNGLTPAKLDVRLHGVATNGASTTAPREQEQQSFIAANPSNNTDLTILFGSNAGTCLSLAQKLASNLLTTLGIKAIVRDMDSGIDDLRPGKITVIITASYEGEPPDNAARFVKWLQSSIQKDLQNVKFALFGCGDKEWHSTFHRIPKLVDQAMAERGADRLISPGLSDVSMGRVMDDFEEWKDQLFTILREMNGNQEAIPHELDLSSQVEIVNAKRAEELNSGMSVGIVQEVKVLTSIGQPEKRHMKIQLPSGSTYECGDYLGVLPQNPDALLRRVMAHWHLPWDATMIFKSNVFAPLPPDVPLSIYDILKNYFELSQPASRKNLELCSKFTNDATASEKLAAYISNPEQTEESKLIPRESLFDVLSSNPEIKLPFSAFLSTLMPLRPRQYSISSSPFSDASSCTITYSVIKKSESEEKEKYEGVATTYLANLKVGDSVQVATRRTSTASKACPFRLPADQTQTPLLMFCAGTGLAPFRGFIQQRAVMLEENEKLKLAPALLFVGCRSATKDRLYAEELDHWDKIGAVDVRYAFSQEPEKAEGCKYVADRMLHDNEDVAKLWAQGARAYVCGSRGVSKSIGEASRKLFDVAFKETEDIDRDARRAKFLRALTERAVSDVFN